MMTFSLFLILMAFLVAAVTFFHYTQGLFSGVISAILAAFSAVIALSYHETVVEKLLGGAMADSANGAVVLAMFAGIYLVLRMVFDQLVPGGVQMPAMADKIGGAVMGLVAGTFAAGVVAFAAQSLPFNPAILGYSRMEVEETSAGIRTGGSTGKTKTYPLYDAMMNDKPLHTVDGTQQQKMYLPADDVLVSTAMMLSDRGALSSSKPLASVHPDWLLELFGQRVGVQSVAKRVLLNPPDGSAGDVSLAADDSHLGAGVYYLENEKGKERTLFQQGGEIESVSKLRPAGPEDRFGGTRLGRGEIGVVVRVFFSKKAKDNKDSLIRLSMGAVRICTQKNDPGTGEMTWANYFPIGTLEPSTEPNPPANDRFSVYLQRPDDYLFIDDSSGGDVKVSWDHPAEAKLAGVDRRKAAGAGPPPERYVEPVGDKGIDLVFRIEGNGFLTNPADPKSDLTAGTFLEVKRLARIDLAGVKMKPLAALPRSAATKIFRKELLKNQLVTVSTLARGIVGNWESSTVPNPKGDSQAATLAVRADGTATLSVAPGPGTSGTFAPRSTPGTWKVDRVAGDSAILVKFTFRENVGLPTSDTATLTFNPELTNFVYASGAPGMSGISFDRRAGESAPTVAAAGGPPAPAAPPAAVTPPPAAAAPATPPSPAAAPAAKPDPTLTATDPQDNNKFFQQIGAPAGTSGEVPVAGGTVTLDKGKIRALALPLATQAQLRGTGEPVNSLGVPEGTRMVQFECQLGAGAATGWEWVAAADSMEVTDTTGAKHKLAGAWAVMPGESVTGRYSADAPLSFAGFAPAAGKPTLVVLAFNLPEAAEAKELTSSNGRIWTKK
jgi:hypothetical protein